MTDIDSTPMTWAQALVCEKCGRGLDVPGALVFSPPLTNGNVRKHHICADCYPLTVPTDAPEAEPAAPAPGPSDPQPVPDDKITFVVHWTSDDTGRFQMLSAARIDSPEPQPSPPTPDPTDPQPVALAYRVGDLDDGWEVEAYEGTWVAPSSVLGSARRPARRKAPPLTPREGDVVEGPGAEPWPVAYVAHGLAIVDTGETLLAYSLSDLTVTDRPPARPVRVWLTDEQVAEVAAWTTTASPDVSTHAAYVHACRALVDGEV